MKKLLIIPAVAVVCCGAGYAIGTAICVVAWRAGSGESQHLTLRDWADTLEEQRRTKERIRRECYC